MTDNGQVPTHTPKGKTVEADASVTSFLRPGQVQLYKTALFFPSRVQMPQIQMEYEDTYLVLVENNWFYVHLLFSFPTTVVGNLLMIENM